MTKPPIIIPLIDYIEKVANSSIFLADNDPEAVMRVNEIVITLRECSELASRLVDKETYEEESIGLVLLYAITAVVGMSLSDGNEKVERLRNFCHEESKYNAAEAMNWLRENNDV